MSGKKKADEMLSKSILKGVAKEGIDREKIEDIKHFISSILGSDVFPDVQINKMKMEKVHKLMFDSIFCVFGSRCDQLARVLQQRTLTPQLLKVSKKMKNSLKQASNT